MAKKKFGARVFRMNDDTVLVVQTVKSGDQQNADYVTDHVGAKNREKWVPWDDDALLASAIRDALQGMLEP